MVRIVLYFVFSLILIGPVSALTDPAVSVGDTVAVYPPQPNVEGGSIKHTRKFASLSNRMVGHATVGRGFTTTIKSPTNNEQQLRQRIDASYNEVKSNNRFINSIQRSSEIEFPVGIEVNAGALTYTVLIDSIVDYKNESHLFASMKFNVPQSSRSIHFISGPILMNRSGKLIGDAKLHLVGDYEIPIDSGKTMLVIKGEAQKTYVDFDCRGFRQLSLDASLLFSNSLLVPEDNQGEIIEDGNVTIDFTTTVSDWNDILVEVKIPKFQIKSLKDVTFSVDGAVLDFSDIRNPLGIQFPTGYQAQSPQFIEHNANVWSGVFIRDVTITLPRQFERTDLNGKTISGSSHRISLKGNNLILDNVGFTGKISATNLIPIEQGRLGKWEYSLETIFIDVASNEIRDGGFTGKLKIPLSQNSARQGETLLAYKAMIKDGNYVFNVAIRDSLQFDLWKAKVRLDRASYVEVNVVDGKFLPKASLNGVMSMKVGMKDTGIASSDNSKNLHIPELRFQGLEIQSVKPYLKPGMFSLGNQGSEPKLTGFNLSINNISAESRDNTVELGINLKLNLVGKGDNGFGADGKVLIISECVDNDTKISYEFKKLQVERFAINIDKGSFKFNGALVFFREHSVYGNGIGGSLKASFNPGINVMASALFGSKDGFHYWFADALVKFNQGLLLFPSIAAYSFGGGAYYHMKIDDQAIGVPIGEKTSPVNYIPDINTNLGLKAVMSLGIQPGKQAFNAELTFEMAFNKNGGLRYINFRGNGYFMTPPVPESISKLQEKAQKLARYAKMTHATGGNLNEGPSDEATKQILGLVTEQGAKAQVWASTMINYDFESRVLHGNLHAFINVASGLIKGAGPAGHAGEAVLHFAPGEWYIYIGRPEYENRFAISVLGLARLDAYFVIGSVVPDSPPPPPNVASILGDIDLDYMKDLNSLEDGAGIGFGASFRVDTGNLSFLIFYGRFAAGLGFDIMLKDYGNVSCAGRGPLGINGWYANSQAYAYFEGAIGIRVRLFGRKTQIPILELGAAVVAQAKLPNPIWIKGIAGGKYNVLGGLVKGHCRFEIEIGKECQIIKNNSQPESSALEGLEAIAQITPQENATAVDVFTLPQAIFNYEIDKEYELVNENDRPVKFKIGLDAFSIKGQEGGVKASLMWNDDRTVAALNPVEILPSEQDLTIEVKTSFQELRNGHWLVSTVDGKPLSDVRTTRFKTGKAPDYIPANNIAYSYPSVNQYNYYKNEYKEGYIVLKQGQSYLFEDPQWKPVVRFTTTGEVPIQLPASYSPNSKEIRTSLSQDLLNDRIYKLSVVNVPATEKFTAIDANITTSSITTFKDESTEIHIQQRHAEGTLRENQEKEIYSAAFRTSKYSTFVEKVGNSQPSLGWRDPIWPGVHKIGSNFGGTEAFSLEENTGVNNLAPLVRMEADLSSVSWYSEKIYPLIYQNMKLEGLKISNRNINDKGLIPTRSVSLYQYPYMIGLTGDEISAGRIIARQPVGRFDYEVALYMYYDFLDFSNQAANLIYNRGISNDRLIKLVTSTFPPISKGYYWINIHYTLPGKNIITSTYRHRIFNPID